MTSMNKKMTAAVLAVTLVMSLSACSNWSKRDRNTALGAGAGAIGGAVLGGFLGNTIGGGTGRSLATAAGAVAGGVAGQGVQGAMNKTQGVELEIRKDDGNTILVVQKQGTTPFSVGQRVAIAGSGSQVTVSPR